MRTYILSMCDMRTKKYCRFQCQASSFQEAVAMAQKTLNGGFPLSSGKEVRHAAVHA